MFDEYEKLFLFRIKLPNGTSIYRLDEDEADAVRSAIESHRPVPPAQAQRLIPFGEGVEVVGERISASYRGVFLGVFPTLKKALKAWDIEERKERASLDQDAELEAIDSRYFAELTYDKDGYKVFRPRPQIA